MLTLCNSIKNRLQHRCFPVKFAKNFNNTFFYRTAPVAIWGLVFSKEFRTKTGVTVSDNYQISLIKSIMINKISQTVLWYFYHKKLFYDEVHVVKHYRWDYFWMCEFDADAKIELKLSLLWRRITFLLKRYIPKHKGWAKRRMFLSSSYFKKRRIIVYLTKTVLKTTSNSIFNMKNVDIDES